MKKNALLDEDRLVTKAVNVLFKGLGAVDATRFLSLPKKKRMESVKRHRLWQATMDQEAFVERVFATPKKR